MQRRIEGTYQNPEEVVKAVERLLNEGYEGEEIVVITDNKSDYQKELDDLTLIEVDSVNPNEGLSFWEKAKEILSFGNYDADEASGPLTEYGIDENDAQSYNEALKNGDILLLVDKNEPKNMENTTEDNEHNQAQEVSGNVTNQKGKAINQSKEEMKEDYVPSPGEKEVFDPTKAQSSREDKPSDKELEEMNKEEESSMNDNELDKKNYEEAGDIPEHSADAQQLSEEDQAASGDNQNRLDDEEAPQLTGDETSVTLDDEGTHVYQDKVNTGYTEGSTEDPIKSPLNAEEKNEKEPYEYINKPESDAYYSDDYKKTGGKSIEDDERKN